MTTQSKAMPGPPLESQGFAPAVIPASQLLYWSLRREFWESRSLYVAPLAVAALFLFGFLIGLSQLPDRMCAASALTAARQQELIQEPYLFAAGLLMAAAALVSVFYCLDALHSERRDRSILFWKSLPVSDLTSVLSKASIPIVVLPLLVFAVTFLTHWIMLLLSTAVLLGSGQSVATLWTQVSLVHMSLLLLYHLVAMHGLWHAPFYGWLLLVSAWARRAPFLWAALPPLAIVFVEKMAFNTSYFTALLEYRLTGDPEGGAFTAGSMSLDSLTHLNPGEFVSSSGLWMGLGFTALCLAAAARLRRYREPL